MLLKRFYDDKLAQASYMVGCQATGEAIIVDPNRDVQQYIASAKSEGLRIAQVTETHIHADFVSGSRDLAQKTGAKLLLSGEGGKDWRYNFAESSGARVLRDGDVIAIGNINLGVRHTPGHTPEHIVFVITDTPAADRPMGVLTGDFVFVGDVGRPDLLERAAGHPGTMDQAARVLFASIQRFKDLPDYLQLWPGHGAGSACGKALGAVPSTTLGYERIANWAFAVNDEDEFVCSVLKGQPEPPKYFAVMKPMNRDGPHLLSGALTPPLADAHELAKLLDTGAQVIDTRSAAAFAAQHVSGAINVPFNRSFINWAGSLVSYDRDLYLIADPSQVAAIARDLSLIGLEKIAGYFGTDVVDVWSSGGGATSVTHQMNVTQLAAARAAGQVQIIDVRANSEWNAGHIPGATNIPLGMLQDRLSELSRDKPLAIHCQSGARSAIGASILEANGFTNVSNVSGGFAAWESEGMEIKTA